MRECAIALIVAGQRRLVEGYFELRALGATQLKGVSDPVDVYEVTGLGPLRTHFQLSARRGLTKFVGREREVAEMKRALELARTSHGQIVAAVAEEETGKSRPVYEFKQLIQNDCIVLEAYSVSHGKASAYLPVLELLYRYFGIEEADDKAARRLKIEIADQSARPGAQRCAAATLFPIDAAHRTRDSGRSRTLAQDRPMLLP